MEKNNKKDPKKQPGSTFQIPHSGHEIETPP